MSSKHQQVKAAETLPGAGLVPNSCVCPRACVGSDRPPE